MDFVEKRICLVNEERIVSISLPAADDAILRVRRFSPATRGPAVLLLHGLGERGSVFYPAAGAGLAPWLAEAGYDVYVPDLRDRTADSAPVPDISQHELICEDLPALFELITAEHPDERFAVIAHGWGGVLAASALIRQPAWLERIAGLIHISARRVCQQRNWQRWLLLELMWNRLAPLLGRRQGVVPLSRLGLGSADLSRKLHADSQLWQNGGNWRDPQDGFDYAAALAAIRWPSSLYLAGHRDRCMGHFADVKAFARELGSHDAQLVLLRKGSGSARDYGHLDVLTHPQAVNDHFPLMLAWLARQTDADTP